MLDTDYRSSGDHRFINEPIFNELFNKYWNSVYSSCLKYTGSESAAEELTQEIFFSVWKRRTQITILDISKYLHGAAKLNSFNYIRNQSRKRVEHADPVVEPIDHDHPAHQMEFKELNAYFFESCNLLPEPSRRIFMLSREQAMSHKQIAEKMNISVSMVEYHIGNALRKIRKKISAFL